MNQPQRLLKKSRKYASRPNLSAGSSEAGDGWIAAHRKSSDDASSDSSSADDGKLDLRGKRRSLGTAGNKSAVPGKKLSGKLLSLRDTQSTQNSDDAKLGWSGKRRSPSPGTEGNKLAVPSKKSSGKDKTAFFNSDGDSDESSHFSKEQTQGSSGKKSWNDGSSSDDSSTIQESSSSEGSDSSVEEVKKATRKKGGSKITRDPPKRPTMPPKKRDAATKPTISRSSLNRVRNAGVRERTTPSNAPRSDVAKQAEAKANRASISEDIAKVAQLQWYCQRLSETRERLVPCRMLSKGEAAKHRGEDASKTTKVIQYLTVNGSNEGRCKCVDGSLLTPMGYTSKDGLSATFNDDYLQRYMQKESKTTSPSDLEVMRAYIKRVFDHAREMQQKRAKEKANRDELDFCESSSDEDEGHPPFAASGRKGVQFDVGEKAGRESDDEGDDLEVPYTQAITFDPDDFCVDLDEEQSNEPLRSGDIIQYYSPIFVAGDSRGLREASVLSVRPSSETVLVLSNGEVLPNDTKVKRIKVKSGRELVEHSGIFRPIDRFRLIEGGCATTADAIAMEAGRFGKIMQKNADRMREKAEAEGFAPMDLLVFKGAKTGAAARSTAHPKSSGKQWGRKQDDSPLSSSSDGSGSEVEVANKRQKPMLKAPGKKSAGKSPPSEKVVSGKENGGNTSGTVKTKQSLGSLSSSASLGSSLESSEDELIVDLGKNHSHLTQHVQPASPKAKSAKAPSRARGPALDLSLSSDEDKKDSTNGRRSANPLRTGHPGKSPDKSISSQSSLDTPAASGLKKKRVGKKPAPSDSSKRRLKFGKAPQSTRAAKATTGAGRKPSPSVPSSPASSSSEDSSPSSSLKQPVRKAAGAKSTRHRRKKQLATKKRSSPSSASSDGSDGGLLTKATKCCKANATRPPSRERENSEGWTQDVSHTYGGGGFSFRRVKKKG